MLLAKIDTRHKIISHDLKTIRPPVCTEHYSLYSSCLFAISFEYPPNPASESGQRVTVLILSLTMTLSAEVVTIEFTECPLSARH